MNKVKVNFTAVFQIADGTIFNINKADNIINPDNERYEDAVIKFNVVSERKTKIVTFEAEGYQSDCRLALGDFIIGLIQAIRTTERYEYVETHNMLLPFLEYATSQMGFQSVHLKSPSTNRGGINVQVGLEIERANDLRLNDASRVLVQNDHYGNMFRKCPNCEEFEIRELDKYAKAIKRCPCCGLKLISWK